MKSKKFILVLLLVTALVIAGCAGNESASTESVEEVTIGYFPNLNHGQGLIGVAKGIFQEEFGDVKVNVEIFPRGALFMDALATDQIDIGYVGPAPAINRFLQGGDVKILGNASIGGNVIVTAGDGTITSPEEFNNKRVATPGIACSHDLVLRRWMWNHDLKMENHGGTIEHIIQDPATMIGLFQQGQIDAAAIAEPWASRMEDEIGAEIFVEWNDTPWEGRMPSTVIATTNNFLDENEELATNFLRAHQRVTDYINNNRQESLELMQEEIKKITDQELSLDILDRSLNRTEFTSKLDEGIMQELADISKELGVISGDSSIDGLIDTSLLKEFIN